MGVNKDRLVINLSKRQLSHQELTVLRNGLNFASTPKTIPTAHIVADIEKGIKELPDKTKSSIRASVANILRHRKPPATKDMSDQQNLAMKRLKRDPSIQIISADKGTAIVVMNKDDYQHKINDLLDAPTTYLKITDKRRNPTSKVEKAMNSLLREIRSQPATHNQETKQIQDKLYYFLHSTDANVAIATFYGLPKIHKPEIPLRPITSCIGFPTYRLSKHLVRILSPLLNENFSIKNSNEFAEQIRLQSISSNEITVSFDVVSLFTSIPIELALQVVKQRLVQDNNLTTRTDISLNNIIKLLEFVLRNSFFQIRRLSLSTNFWLCNGFSNKCNISEYSNGTY